MSSDRNCAVQHENIIVAFYILSVRPTLSNNIFLVLKQREYQKSLKQAGYYIVLLEAVDSMTRTLEDTMEVSSILIIYLY